MTRTKYTAKDSVFRDIFEQPEYLLELYQALHTEDKETTVPIWKSLLSSRC